MTTIVEDKILHPQAPDWACAIDENIQLAVRRGLKHLCCVANVARTTGWVNQFVCAVRTAQAANPKVEVRCGLKAELLNQFGALDLPRSTAGADYVYLAMRQFPLGDRCYSPAEIRKQLRSGDLDAGQLITALVEATRNAMLAHPGLVIAEMFSILPLVGLDESMVTDSQLRELAQIARLTGASIEVD